MIGWEEMKKIPDGSVDLILVDPPYGTTEPKWDNIIDFGMLWGSLEKLRSQDCCAVLTSARQIFTTKSSFQAMRRIFVRAMELF